MRPGSRLHWLGPETSILEGKQLLGFFSCVLWPHPVVHASELDESIRGVFQHAGALTILLDLDKLLA